MGFWSTLGSGLKNAGQTLVNGGIWAWGKSNRFTNALYNSPLGQKMKNSVMGALGPYGAIAGPAMDAASHLTGAVSSMIPDNYNDVHLV